jgi:energy-coupling factor transporter ATP-binding protein EcfA2
VCILETLTRDETFLEKSSRDLSGGEAQIVALIRCLQLDPAMLLLDEPTASLDNATAEAAEELRYRWQQVASRERSFIWVIHNLEQAKRMSDRGVQMHRGGIQPEEFPVKPWYAPQYAIPLLGKILGNTLNGISLGLDRLGSELAARRAEVEALLALGATRWEAARQPIQQAVRTGLIPIINSIMVVGIVSLPGMVTGQILAGASPLEAVKYQIVIVFLFASGTALGTVSVVLLSYRRLFNSSHQFLYQLVKER